MAELLAIRMYNKKFLCAAIFHVNYFQRHAIHIKYVYFVILIILPLKYQILFFIIVQTSV